MLSKFYCATPLTHYKNFNTDEQKSFESLKKKFLDRFSHFDEKDRFIERLRGQKRFNPSYHLRQILSIFEYYSDVNCMEVMRNCIKYNVFSYNLVKALIQKYPLKQDVLNFTKQELPSKNVKRDLLEYSYGQK
ncbi:hypothetical protein DEFDS_0281 [Deferribacter desulfuricans SSM1]|uniref:Uncharacterized protein n=1 Tax=Deferribacter desulfuricans (strain DSM 14783 / JCM 11476 / NBRC 101012 / SSM1) TaxID=639282 RepID=D3PB16_DEFDS|nr:hypothetical protein [Deferribacter desulfuricans]BAI79789.1 hypothetical protein DEFDS_0281 [Deferribacter desulfuricans SSM1]